jgi:hypothetical protein
MEVIGSCETLLRIRTARRYIREDGNLTTDVRTFNPALTRFLKIMYMKCKSCSCAVGIATSYGLDDRGVGVRVPIGSRIFASPYQPFRLGCPLSLLSSGYQGLFPGGKVAGAWSWPQFQLVPRSRNRGSIHPLPHRPSGHRAHLVKNRVNFNILIFYQRNIFYLLPTDLRMRQWRRWMDGWMRSYCPHIVSNFTVVCNYLAGEAFNITSINKAIPVTGLGDLLDCETLRIRHC